MITLAQFEVVRRKYGHCASWAIWADEGRRPKDGVGDLSVLDPEVNTALLDQLKPDRVLVGLNISRRIERPLGNFHDPRRQAMDFKIRHALKDSILWGAYMTDIIKDFEQKVSGDVISFLRRNETFENEQVRRFCGEIEDLGVTSPTVIAFGADTYRLLAKHLKSKYRLLRIPHYSTYGNRETYRDRVWGLLAPTFRTVPAP